MSESNVDASRSNSTIKILPSTQLSSPLDEANKLLKNWQLPQLCKKFRDEEVCTNAFQHLSEDDISELIPKIGPRSIFRARLSEWRQQQTEQSSDVNSTSSKVKKRKRNLQIALDSSNNNNAKHPHEILMEPTIKLESDDADGNWLNAVEYLQAGAEDGRLHDEAAASTSSSGQVDVQDADTLNRSFSASEEQPFGSSNSCNANVHLCYTKHKHDVVNVQEMLYNNLDGRKVIECYDSTQPLDANQRKKIIKIVVAAVLEKRIAMSADCFHDLARQLVQIFPTEYYETYYVPRIGTTCPKGALYNKYLNMGKRMRREGLLEYRVNRHRATSLKCAETRSTTT